MDPLTAPALAAVLSKIFDGGTNEVGRQAWTALTGLVRRAFGDKDRSRPMRAVAELERHPDDQAKVEELAGALTAAADLDPDFAADLRQWLADAAPAGGNVSNIIGGSAEIRGTVVQARDIHGSITFHDPGAR
jgi:hypothetical protein